MSLVRPEPDAFSLLSEPGPGSRASEESWRVARKLTTVVGRKVPVIDRYLGLLARAPAAHLRILARRGSRVVFAPTIPDALESDWAAERRGRALTAQERMRLHSEYSAESTAAGIFDPGLDILVFPTHYVARDDLERVVLHELGHALTVDRAGPRPILLKHLPRSIAQHIRRRDYGPDDDPDTLRKRVLEVLAEAYVFLLSGREAELPGAVTSELIFILSTVEDSEKHIRFDFDDETERSATRISSSRLAFPDDPEIGELLAPRPPTGARLAAEDLDVDELALRRTRRRAA